MLSSKSSKLRRMAKKLQLKPANGLEELISKSPRWKGFQDLLQKMTIPSFPEALFPELPNPKPQLLSLTDPGLSSRIPPRSKMMMIRVSRSREEKSLLLSLSLRKKRRSLKNLRDLLSAGETEKPMKIVELVPGEQLVALPSNRTIASLKKLDQKGSQTAREQGLLIKVRPQEEVEEAGELESD